MMLTACNQKTETTLTLSGLDPVKFQTTVNDAQTQLYTLKNKAGMEVCITNFGGRIVSIMVPDKNGVMQDVVLGFDSIADYNNSANAIGFSVYYYIDQMYSKPGLRLLAVDGVTPSNDTLADGSYPLCNDFYAVIHPDAAADSPERRLYDWLDTDAGQDCIKKSGYVAVGPQTTVTIVD